MDRAEYEACMAYWEAHQIPGRPVVPLSHQIEVCDYLRREMHERHEREARERLAAKYAPAMTALRGPPWQDLG